MARVIFQVGEEEKALWVEAAHRELVSLSEWLRRAAQVRAGGLAAGEATTARIVSRAGNKADAEMRDDTPRLAVSPAARPPHKADPKGKAEMEHGSRDRSPWSGMCEHRVPLGSFCKRCEDGGLAAGEQPEAERGTRPAEQPLSPAPAASPSFKPDPKVKK